MGKIKKLEDKNLIFFKEDGEQVVLDLDKVKDPKDRKLQQILGNFPKVIWTFKAASPDPFPHGRVLHNVHVEKVPGTEGQFNITWTDESPFDEEE
jgi:hypothetical protein